MDEGNGKREMEGDIQLHITFPSHGCIKTRKNKMEEKDKSLHQIREEMYK